MKKIITISLVAATAGLFFASSTLAITAQNNSINVTIFNKLAANSPCPGGNTLNVFAPNGPPGGYLVPLSGSTTLRHVQNGGPIGIQVNNWYWTFSSSGQNPDNSCGDYKVNYTDCSLSKVGCAYGNGYPTDIIANLETSGNNGSCIIKVTASQYTNSVTKNCCSPSTCKTQNTYNSGTPPLPAP